MLLLIVNSWLRKSLWWANSSTLCNLHLLRVYESHGPSLVAQVVKNLPAMQKTLVRFLGLEDTLEKDMGMATHSSILAWRIPWTEEPGRPQFMGSQRVGHDWATFTLWWGQRLISTLYFKYLISSSQQSYKEGPSSPSPSEGEKTGTERISHLPAGAGKQGLES